MCVYIFTTHITNQRMQKPNHTWLHYYQCLPMGFMCVFYLYLFLFIYVWVSEWMCMNVRVCMCLITFYEGGILKTLGCFIEFIYAKCSFIYSTNLKFGFNVIQRFIYVYVFMYLRMFRPSTLNSLWHFREKHQMLNCV